MSPRKQMKDMLLPLVLFGAILWLLYKRWASVYDHWTKRGVKSVPGRFPLGSDHRLSLMTQYQGHTIDEMYHKFSSQPYFGIYMVRSPFLVVRCPEIISIILTKEFSHFRNRQFLKIYKNDHISHNLFNLEEEKWKAIRSKLHHTFSPVKLKAMFPLFVKCTENFQSLLLKKAGITVDVKDTIACYTTDIICNCLFGLEANTIGRPNNEVTKIGHQATDLNLFVFLKVALNLAFPEVANRFPIKIFPRDVENFFFKLVNDTTEFREINNVKINDFMDLLIQLKKKGIVGEDMRIENEDINCQSQGMTLELMAAQCFFLFVAGFENSSSMQSYSLYEMALNPEIQKKLQNEIDTVIKKHGGVTYDAIKEMVYLDMVVSETFRKYPILPFLTRICTSSLTLPDGLQVEKGDQMLIPLWSLHHDPQYFVDPDKFDPERFSDENKATIKPYTYLPFGEGPRICFGKRFGLLQTKVGLVSILQRFSVEPTKDTVIPLVLKGRAFSTLPQGPVNLKIVSRS